VGGVVETTFGVLKATLDASIMLMAMPDIFRGVRPDPLQPGTECRGSQAAKQASVTIEP
jgi:hypothetical protein